MIQIPPLLGLLQRPAGGDGPLAPFPVEGAVNEIEFNNPNAFPVTIGIERKYIQNASSVGTGGVESPGEDGAGNTAITFV